MYIISCIYFNSFKRRVRKFNTRELSTSEQQGKEKKELEELSSEEMHDMAYMMIFDGARIWKIIVMKKMTHQ